MGRLATLVLIGVMIGVAVFTYSNKHHAVESADRVARLRTEIEQARISLSLLKAEWSTAVQPDRLQGLVNRYSTVLNLVPADVTHMVRIQDLPGGPTVPATDAAALDRLARTMTTQGAR